MPKDVLLQWASLNDERRSILGFLEWLEDHGVQLDFDRADATFNRLDDRKHGAMVDLFHGIDRNELEGARRKLVESLGS